MLVSDSDLLVWLFVWVSILLMAGRVVLVTSSDCRHLRNDRRVVSVCRCRIVRALLGMLPTRTPGTELPRC